MAIDSMITAKRWTATSVTPPLDCYGSTHSTLAWDYANDRREVRVICDKFGNSCEALIEIFKEDRKRQGDEGLWNAPVTYLGIIQFESMFCGDSILSMVLKRPETMKLPLSMFEKSSDAGLWLYSPYLCGTGLAKFLNTAYDWGTKCWERSSCMVGFFHLYNMLLECKHLKKPIKAFERIIEVFKNDIFRGGKRPVLGGAVGRGIDNLSFSEALSKALGTKNEVHANPETKRKAKGGGFVQNSEYPFRSKNKSNDHTLFKGASKLFALGQAEFKKSQLDTRSFPSLVENPPKTAVEFLDALKVDVESDMKGKSPVALLNYNGILSIVMLLMQSMDESLAEMPSVKKRMAQESAKYNTLEFGLHDKIFTLAFGSPDSMMQDSCGERLDTPILRRMASVFEKVWNDIEPDLLPVFLLNDAPDQQLVPKNGPRKFGDSQNSKRVLEESIAHIKDIDPATYRKLKDMVENMPVGDCANCPDCQARVPLEGDLMERLEEKLKHRKAKGKH